MNCIVAVNNDWGIGYKGVQSVVVPEDRRFFRELTNKSIVIVGRKTFEILGRPLTNRMNIVLTRNQNYKTDGAIIAYSFNDVLDEIKQYKNSVDKAQTDNDFEPEYDPEKVFFIGGGSVYELFLPICQHAYVTKIDTNPLSDTFFPDLDDHPDWKLVRKGEVNKSISGVNYSLFIYKNINPT